MHEASAYLSNEVLTVNEAARVALHYIQEDATRTSNYETPFTLSVGSTPTAHAFPSTEALDQITKTLHGKLELHTGNYIFHDLQQLATSLIEPEDIAIRVLASVVSRYVKRGKNETDEVMVDVGGIGMSKDKGPIEGWGDVVAVVNEAGKNAEKEGRWLWAEKETGWRLGRISQEHGILVQKEGFADVQSLTLGSMVAIVGQHACLIASNYPWFYVVDSELEVEAGGIGLRGSTVVEVWVPWKGW